MVGGDRALVTLPGVAVRVMVVVSRQRPSHPYSTQDVVSAGVAFVSGTVGDNVVVSRHPPNHPYFTQDVVGISVVDVELELEVLVELEVVVSSRHPENISCLSKKLWKILAYPTIQASGKSQFAWELPLTSCYATKSTHSSSGIQGGTSSYASSTSWITLRIL